MTKKIPRYSKEKVYMKRTKVDFGRQTFRKKGVPRNPMDLNFVSRSAPGTSTYILTLFKKFYVGSDRMLLTGGKTDHKIKSF